MTSASEQEHIDKFNELLVEKRVRPTALLPLWNFAGFALGAGTALMGEKAAMACTIAVEKVIGEHYREQQDLLEEDEKYTELEGVTVEVNPNNLLYVQNRDFINTNFDKDK